MRFDLPLLAQAAWAYNALIVYLVPRARDGFCRGVFCRGVKLPTTTVAEAFEDLRCPVTPFIARSLEADVEQYCVKELLTSLSFHALYRNCCGV
jgi:hypothetical protein